MSKFEGHMDFTENSEDKANLLGKVERFELMILNEGNLFFDRADFQELVEYYLAIQENDRANTVLSYALEQHPESLELKLAQAHVLMANDAVEKSRHLLCELLTIQPENGDVLMALGTAYGRLKMKKEAINCFLKAINKVEFNEDVYFLLAMEHQSNMEYEKAINYHTKALDENPFFELSLYEILTCFDCIDNPGKATQFYNCFLDENPYNETAWFHLGTVHAKNENYQQAVIAYDYALAINPYFSSALFNKANSLASDEMYEEAILCYEETFEYEAPNHITYCYIGECYERLNNLDQALHYFEQSLQKKDLHADAWLGKAIILNLKNNHKQAYQYIKKALAIDDKEPDYWYTCAEIEEKLGLIEASLYSIEMSITLDHEDVNLMIYYVQLIYRNMDIISSFEVLNDAIGTFPKESKLLYFKTGLYLCSGHYNEAYNSLERALRINIGNAHFLFDNFPEAKKDQNLLKLISEMQN